MRQSLRLLALSGILGLVLAAAFARPALAACHTCFKVDFDCTGEVIYGNHVCCSPDRGVVCQTYYDSNGCVVSVTTSCA